MTSSEFMNTQEGQEGLDPDFVKRLRAERSRTLGMAWHRRTKREVRKKWPSLLRYWLWR